MNNIKHHELENIAKRCRQRIMESCYRNGGHISTSMSCVEILTSLYCAQQDRLHKDKIINKHSDRDIFIMSKGHGENALYSMLIELEYFPEDWLFSHYRKGEFLLGGHVDSLVPGVEVSTGALGHGCSVACGMALAKKKLAVGGEVFCLIGDGECSEGSVWESVIFAINNELSNLTFIIDDNKIGSLDFVDNYIKFKRSEAFKGFGANVIDVDGHNIKKIDDALNHSTNIFTVIVADTVKGKGVSCVENDPIWHVKKVDEKTYNAGKQELGF